MLIFASQRWLERCARSCSNPEWVPFLGIVGFVPCSKVWRFGLEQLDASRLECWCGGADDVVGDPLGGIFVYAVVVEAGDWSELLKRGLCEDTGLLGPLRQLGLKYRFEPSC